MARRCLSCELSLAAGGGGGGVEVAAAVEVRVWNHASSMVGYALVVHATEQSMNTDIP